MPVYRRNASNFLEKAALSNKPVDCVLLGLAVHGGFSLPWDRRPSVYTPYPCGYSRRDRYGNSSNFAADTTLNDGTTLVAPSSAPIGRYPDREDR